MIYRMSEKTKENSLLFGHGNMVYVEVAHMKMILEEKSFSPREEKETKYIYKLIKRT